MTLYEPDRPNKNFNNREPKKEGTHKQKYFGRNVGIYFFISISTTALVRRRAGAW